MKVQLLFFVGCPHVDETRRALRAALEATGAGNLVVEELDVEAATTPPHLRGWGSPTILINGADIGGEARPTGMSCRLYPGGTPPGVPPREKIEGELLRAMSNR
jgi:mercuric ion transport protein